jgi:hypothetical protein
MADSNVPITAGSGTLIDTRTNAASENRQVIVLGEGQLQSDLIAIFRPDSVLRIAADPTTVLVDPFDTLDTTNTWTLGGNNVPTQSAGRLTVSAAITASMQSTIRSQPVFIYQSPAFLEGTFAVTLEAGVVTGNKRCWGFGTLPATSTTAIPLVNGVCFEIDSTSGALLGAAYSNSTRTQTVALTRPADGAEHRYSLYYKTSVVYFEIDGIAVGSIAWPDPQIMNLPLVMVSVNASSGQPGTAAVLQFSTVSVADHGRNSLSIVDGTFPWREASVSATGAQKVAGEAPATGTITSVAAAVTSTTILASNVLRKGASVFNDSTANLYLGLTASAVSLTAYTVKVPAGALFEVNWPVYTGQMTGIWDAAVGNARVTELT